MSFNVSPTLCVHTNPCGWWQTFNQSIKRFWTRTTQLSFSLAWHLILNMQTMSINAVSAINYSVYITRYKPKILQICTNTISNKHEELADITRHHDRTHNIQDTKHTKLHIHLHCFRSYYYWLHVSKVEHKWNIFTKDKTEFMYVLITNTILSH